MLPIHYAATSHLAVSEGREPGNCVLPGRPVSRIHHPRVDARRRRRRNPAVPPRGAVAVGGRDDGGTRGHGPMPCRHIARGGRSHLGTDTATFFRSTTTPSGRAAPRLCPVPGAPHRRFKCAPEDGTGDSPCTWRRTFKSSMWSTVRAQLWAPPGARMGRFRANRRVGPDPDRRRYPPEG
jgi:hypothetical protein